MNKIRRRVYWDSSAFLAWLLPEPDREDHCKEVLDAAESGELEIVTSAVTLTEVIKIGKSAPRLKEADEEKIRLFFENPYILIFSTTRIVAELARQLIWKHPKLKPKDSIHLASAILAKIGEVHSYDRDHLSLDGLIGSPPVKICTPQMVQRTLKYPENAGNEDELGDPEEVEELGSEEE